MYFELLKSIFSELYRKKNPLATDLKCENATRSLLAQHLLHLGDLSKFKLDQKNSKEESWNFYTRAKTVYPFDGRIYNAFAAMCQKENDILASIYFLMRSLACELPHDASREFLFDYFEEIRLKFIAE
jgi:glutathionyl-hydroquinone reductase